MYPHPKGTGTVQISGKPIPLPCINLRPAVIPRMVKIFAFLRSSTGSDLRRDPSSRSDAGGAESNAALLICEFGWHGVLLDGDGLQIEKPESFTGRRIQLAVRVEQCMVDPENAKTVVSDLLDGQDPAVISIDVDGWISDRKSPAICRRFSSSK